MGSRRQAGSPGGVGGDAPSPETVFSLHVGLTVLVLQVDYAIVKVGGSFKCPLISSRQTALAFRHTDLRTDRKFWRCVSAKALAQQKKYPGEGPNLSRAVDTSSW